MNSTLFASSLVFFGAVGCSGQLDVGGTQPPSGAPQGPSTTPAASENTAKPNVTPTAAACTTLATTPAALMSETDLMSFAPSGTELVFLRFAAQQKSSLGRIGIGVGQQPVTLLEKSGNDFVGWHLAVDARRTAYTTGVVIPNEESHTSEVRALFVRENASGNTTEIALPSGFDRVHGVELHGDDVYFAALPGPESGDGHQVVFRWDGSAATKVAELPYGSPWKIGDTGLFAVEDGKLRRYAAGSTTIVREGASLLGVDGGRIYFTTAALENVQSMDESGGDEKTIAAGVTGTLAFAPSEIFIVPTSRHAIYRVSRNGGAVTVAVQEKKELDADLIGNVRADRCNLYWSVRGTLKGMALPK